MRTMTLAFPFFLGACGGGGGEPLAGPCLVNVGEPVVRIASAVDANTGASLAEVSLENIQFNGVTANLAAVTAVSLNVTVGGNALLCKLPCAFASSEGLYTFAATASGYETRLISISAQYATRTGNCPMVMSGATTTNISLAPK